MLRTGDLSSQWKWHETFRDTAKNMYRTSYTDMIHGREIAVQNDFPSGYGGHVPSLRHDILFRNTGFDRQKALMQYDVSRDANPSFKGQIEGVPTYSSKPRGAKKVPTAGTLGGGAKYFNALPPWAVQVPLYEVPTFRTGIPENSPSRRNQDSSPEKQK